MNVRIYKPCKNTMQSGFVKTHGWVLEALSICDKGIDPVMSWTTSSDTIDMVKMNFDSKDSAVAFAENKGWDYDIIFVNSRSIKPKSYLDNFK